MLEMKEDSVLLRLKMKMMLLNSSLKLFQMLVIKARLKLVLMSLLVNSLTANLRSIILLRNKVFMIEY